MRAVVCPCCKKNMVYWGNVASTFSVMFGDVYRCISCDEYKTIWMFVRREA